MINWDNFYVFAAVSICLWLAGAVFALRSSSKSKVAIVFTSGGIIILGIFIAGLWIFLQRPPLRTMGETRLWYSFFMGIAGLLTYIRWKYRWILSFSTLLSTVFVIINLMKPEIHDQSLMPALQSVWFIPHVTVYMFSYSVLGCAFIIALTGLFRHKEEYLHTADNLVYAGVAFLSIGMAALLLIPTALVILEHKRASENLNLMEILGANADMHGLLYSPYGMGLTAICLYLLLLGLCHKKYRTESIMLLFVSFCGAAAWILNGTLYARAKILIPFVPLVVLQCAKLLNELRMEKTYLEALALFDCSCMLVLFRSKNTFPWIAADLGILLFVVLVSK